MFEALWKGAKKVGDWVNKLGLSKKEYNKQKVGD